MTYVLKAAIALLVLLLGCQNKVHASVRGNSRGERVLKGIMQDGDDDDGSIGTRKMTKSNNFTMTKPSISEIGGDDDDDGSSMGSSPPASMVDDPVMKKDKKDKGSKMKKGGGETDGAPFIAPIFQSPVFAAPSTSVPSTQSAPSSGIDCPFVPVGGCSVCGENMCVGDDGAHFIFPGQDIITCGLLQERGLNGQLSYSFCLFLPGFIQNTCSCRLAERLAPNLSPAKFPSATPVTIATVSPTFSTQTVPSIATPSKLDTSSPAVSPTEAPFPTPLASVLSSVPSLRPPMPMSVTPRPSLRPTSATLTRKPSSFTSPTTGMEDVPLTEVPTVEPPSRTPSFSSTVSPTTTVPAPATFLPSSSPTTVSPSASPMLIAPNPTSRPSPAPTISPPSRKPTPVPTSFRTSKPTPMPTLATNKPPTLYSLLQPELIRGDEFDNPTSYQSKALSFLEDSLSGKSNDQYKTYFSLACIYYASNGVANKWTELGAVIPSWISSQNWATNNDYCSWYGITCTDGLVTKIDLANNRLYGTWAPEVQMLKSSLQTIDLYNNFYLAADGDAGHSWIAQMTNLRELFYGTTSFEYNGIPTYIGRLSNLREFDCSYTLYLDGPIRAEAFAENPLLEYVDIGSNSYTSTVPPTITNHPSIKFFYLDNVLLYDVSQSLDFLVGMRSLLETWNDFTSFQGGLPTGLGTLSTLKSLSLTFCGLTGPIPSELGNLGNSLDRLWLQQNLLTGRIPAELAGLSRIQILYLEGNRLEGTMPSELCSYFPPGGLLSNLGADCDELNPYPIECSCCTCCGAIECEDF